MQEYYAENRDKFKKEMNSYLRLIAPELERVTQLPYTKVFRKIWRLYEREMLEHFPYIGGDESSGTSNLTGAYYFVAMGEVLKPYGITVERSGKLMVIAYQRYMKKFPGIVKLMMKLMMRMPKMIQLAFMQKDEQNRKNAAKNPGSFETRTLSVPDEGCIFTYRNLVCPLSDFARKYGYEEYMPYLCNLDYVMFGELGVPLYRTHTCFEDDDYCDFSIKRGAEIMKAWPPVFTQGKGYK